MKIEREKVAIDQLDMLDQATGFGLFCKVVEDMLPKNATSEEKQMIPALVGSLMGRMHFGNDGFRALLIALIDAGVNRGVLLGTKNAVRWPAWDPEDHNNEDCHPLCDVFFSYYSYVLYSQKKVVVPDFALGPIFTLSGIAMEGIARGYHVVDDNMKELYPKFKETVEKSFAEHGDPSLDLQSTLQSLALFGDTRRIKHSA